MNTKNLVVMALLVGMGAILHMIIPGFGAGGMKPDFSLIMMFLGIFMFPEKKNVLLLGLATGIISGLTTGFAGGFFPNVIDKMITAFLFFALYVTVKKTNNIVINASLTAVGTIISGTIFLTVAAAMVGLGEAGFIGLFTMIVIPAMILNTIVMAVIYPTVLGIAKRTKLVHLPQ
ncbi:tryptophan transporter [Bacillus kwashiorkori]|uniref:tryptophan transporter n=1 Tax=Bacillus kwashiorkori TaxID=1522318 RepID=UPI0007805048|nr:tryptophan transporter [Bacillus kwashiorkori]